MAKVFCDECLRTYTPYTYRETIQRAIVSGVDEWEGIDDKDHISCRYSKYIHDHYTRRYLYYQGVLSTRLNDIFPNVENFNNCFERFNRERHNKISASFLCFDCEKYLCAKCITQHSEHFTFSEDDKNNTNNWDKIETKIVQAFIAEGDTKEQYIQQERAVLCDVVDVKDSVSVTEWEKIISNKNKDVQMLWSELDRCYLAWHICILNDSHSFLVINYWSTRIQIYNIGTYKLIDSIELPYRPAGITKLPSTDPSQSLIAVSFPNQRQIDIMNIQCKPADNFSSIHVQGIYLDLSYCNNKLITRCETYMYEDCRNSIHVMDLSGKIINVIDFNKLPGFIPEWLYKCRMCVHSESETIYVCHRYYGVTCMSLTGQVLHTTRFTDLIPRHICVDRDQNVYVMEHWLPLYRLSSDRSERVKIIDKDEANVGEVTSIRHHKNEIYVADMEGFVFIFNVA